MIFGDLFTSKKTLAIREQTEAIRENTAALTGNTSAQNANNQVQNAGSITGFISNIRRLTAEQKALATANGTQLTSWTNLSIGVGATTKAVGSFIAANPVGAILLAVSAIYTLVNAYDALTISVEETRERAENLIADYEKALDEANNNANTVEDLAEKYEELSQGVDNLGQNVSLTTEEYKEYNSIVNQIANMFPELISGYTEEGNAILSLKGDVEQLRDAYKEAQQEAYNMLLADSTRESAGGNDIIQNYRNIAFGNQDLWDTAPGQDNAGLIETIDILKDIQEITNATDFQEYINNLQKVTNISSSDYLKNAFKNSGLNDLIYRNNYEGSITNEDLSNVKNNIQSIIQAYEAEVDIELQKVTSLANAYLNTNPKYDELDSETKNVASIIVNSLDRNIAAQFNSSSDVGAYVDDILQLISTDEIFKNSLTDLLTLDTSNMSLNEVTKAIDTYLNIISNKLNQDKENLKISLGFSDLFEMDEKVDDEISKSASYFASRFEGALSESDYRGLQDTIKQFFETQSIDSDDEIALWVEIRSKIDNVNLAMQEYIKQKNSMESIPVELSFGDTFAELEEMTDQFNALDEAYTNFADGDKDTNITFENLASLKEQFADVKGIDNYIKAIQDAEGNTEATQKAFDDLAGALIEQSGILDIVNEKNADLITKYLEENGVTNASIIVQNALAQKLDEVAAKKWLAANASIDFNNATAGEIQALIDEGVYAGVAEGALIKLVAQKIIANSTAITTSGDIENLKALALQAGATAEAVAKVKEAGSGRLYSNNPDKAKSYLSGLIDDAVNANYGTGNAVNTPQYSGGSATQSARDSGGSGSSSSEQEFDWIERRLDYIERKRNEIEANNTSLISMIGLTDEDISRAQEILNKTTTPLTKDLRELRDMADNAGLSISELFNIVQSGVNNVSNQGYLSQLIELDKAELDVYNQAVEEYRKQYEESASKLSDDLRSKIETGDFSIETYSGDQTDDIQKAIDDYDKLTSAIENQQEVLNNLISSTKEYYENTIKYLDYEYDKIEANNDQINSTIDYLEASGKIVSETSYNSLIGNLQQQESILQSKINEKYKELEALSEVGGVSENSEEYAELMDYINDCTQSLMDLKTQQEEYNYQLRMMPINTMDTAIGMYDDIITNIENWGSKAEASGKNLNEKYYNTLIDSGEELIAQYEDQASLIEDAMSYYDVGSDRWNELYDKLQSVNSEISSMETQLIEWNNTLLEMPIDRMDDVISMYNDAITAIENWGSEIEASGKKLDDEYYKSLISNGFELIGQYEEQAKLIKDVMSEYDVGSEKWNELYSRLQNINSEMSSMVDNLHEWNNALLEMPLTSIDDQTEGLQNVLDALNEVQTDYDSVISAVTTAINDQIEVLREQQEIEEEAIQSQIDALQDKLDLMQQQNEELNLQIAYEQALYDLEVANTQKTEAVIRNGEKIYEANAESIRNAQEDVQDALYDIEVYKIEQQIEELEDALDAVSDKYDEQVEKLEEQAEKWEEIKNSIEEAANASIANEQLGSDWKDQVLSGDDEDIYELFKDNYESNAELITKYEEQIESTENIYSLLEQYIESYKEGTISYEQAMTGIKDILSQMNQEMSSGQNLKNILEYLGTTNGSTSSDADSVLEAVQKSLTESSNQLIKSLEEYNDNLDMIADCMTSWEQLTTNISDIKDLTESILEGNELNMSGIRSDISDVKDLIEEVVDAIENIDITYEFDDDYDYDDFSEDERETAGNIGDAISDGFKDVVNSIDNTDRDYSHYGPGYVYKNGIENGLIGDKNPNAIAKDVSLLALGKLDKDAVPIIAHEGEAVINPEQMKQLVENFDAVSNIPKFVPIIDNSKISGVGYPRNFENNIEIKIGDITLPNVKNGDDFAKAMGTRFGILLKQEMGKF